jgi:glycosyltransferase involved in cell wall biosynthesis
MLDKTQLPRFLIVDQCDFVGYPSGGTLTFARQVARVFKGDVALAGLVTDDSPVGVWFQREIESSTQWFYGIGRVPVRTMRPLVPQRLSTLAMFLRHQKGIRSLGVDRLFTRTPQFMLGINKDLWSSVCFTFAGTGNSVALSRYQFVRWAGGMYERVLFKSLRDKADRVLAAADQESIDLLVARSGGLLKSGSVRAFPTRFEEKTFYPQEPKVVRHRLGLPEDVVTIVVSGKLSWVKGWTFALEAFRRLLARNSRSLMIFLGDGEDRFKLERAAQDLINAGQVKVLGRVSPSTVNDYLGASDVVFVGSFVEGWSNAMIEGLACGRPIVSTRVGGVNEMVVPGKNGFILSERDPEVAANFLLESRRLDDAREVSVAIAAKYGSSTLVSDLEREWLQDPLEGER